MRILMATNFEKERKHGCVHIRIVRGTWFHWWTFSHLEIVWYTPPFPKWTKPPGQGHADTTDTEIHIFRRAIVRMFRPAQMKRTMREIILVHIKWPEQFCCESSLNQPWVPVKWHPGHVMFWHMANENTQMLQKWNQRLIYIVAMFPPHVLYKHRGHMGAKMTNPAGAEVVPDLWYDITFLTLSSDKAVAFPMITGGCAKVE